MYRFYISLAFLILISIVIFAQTPPDTLWTRTFGGSGNDYSWSVQQTTDNGFILVGRKYYNSNYWIWMIKTDEYGNEEWNHSYGDQNDYAYSVQQTTDGGFIIAGVSWDSYDQDFLLIKTDENGIEEWSHTYGNTWASSYARSVQQTNDGGYIITGETDWYGAGLDDFWLIKTDENGIEEWNQTYGGSGWDQSRSVQQTTDGGYIVTGETDSFGVGSCNFWLIKTDANGIEEWNHTYGGSEENYALSVQQTTDGGYIMAGYTNSFGAGSYDFFLVKTDEYGIEEWNQTYGGSYDEIAYSVQQTSDYGYTLAGWTDSFGAGSLDVWLVKTDENGNEEWNKTCGGTDDDYAHSIWQTTDEGYIVAGSTKSYGAGSSDFWLIRVDSEFNPEFSVDNNCGIIPFQVNFHDESGGSPTHWFWDFQNDGIYDSNDQNPTHTYTEPGIYDVKLKISNETQVDSLIKYDYITVELVPPVSPENVQIEISENDVLLNWAEVDSTIFGSPINVDYYLIYHSLNPYEDFYYLGATQDTTFTHNLVIPFEDKMFYYIKSFVGTRRELEEFIRVSGD